MAELKREYVVPLRRKTRYAPKWRRSKKAVSVLREFIKKHMKTDSVVICPELNETIWQRGIKNPPGKVSVVALKMQNAQGEKTLVNLLDVGVDKYAEAYRVQETKEQSKSEETETSKEDKKDVVAEEQTQETLEEDKEQAQEEEETKGEEDEKKKSAKKEVEKNE